MGSADESRQNTLVPLTGDPLEAVDNDPLGGAVFRGWLFGKTIGLSFVFLLLLAGAPVLGPQLPLIVFGFAFCGGVLAHVRREMRPDLIEAALASASPRPASAETIETSALVGTPAHGRLDDREEALAADLAGFLVAEGSDPEQSRATVDHWIAKILATSEPSERVEPRYLEMSDRPEVLEFLEAQREAGASDADLAWWWTASWLEQRLVERWNERCYVQCFVACSLEIERDDPDDADDETVKLVSKTMPIFSVRGGLSPLVEDGALPIALWRRLGSLVAIDVQPGRELARGHTSFNAFVRAKLRAGPA